MTLTPNPIAVPKGETVTITFEADNPFVYGAGFGAEDAKTAEAQGWMGPKERRATIAVRGLKQGRTRLILQYASGLSVWRTPVAEIIVGPCDSPTVALNAQSARVGEGSDVTVTAMTTGSDVHIEWYQDGRFRGLGPTFTLHDLPRGKYRVHARVSNGCATTVSSELLVEVLAPRRRAMR